LGAGAVLRAGLRAGQQRELHAAVLGARRLGLARVDRLVGAVAAGDQAVLGDALGHEVVLHGLGAPLRQVAVVLGAAGVVGVAGDLDAQVRVLLEDLERPVEGAERGAGEIRRVHLEVDALDDAGELLDLLGHLVRAAVAVLVPVHGLDLGRALVVGVGDAVAVVVRIRAAVLVLVAVLVLRLRRALIGRADQTVAVLVALRAAVGVVDAVHGLGLVRALII